jgi:hypothetical protein
MRGAALTIVVIVVVITILEITVGSFPTTLFTFPLNILCMGLWLLAIFYAYRNRDTSSIAKFMLSRKATWLSLFIMAVIGIVLGLERKPSSDAWAVVVGILFVLSHLTFVLLRGWKSGDGIRWRFSITHLGLWLALGAGFWGAPDVEELRLPLVEGRPCSEAYVRDGRSVPLGYEMTLLDFEAAYYDNGTPSDFVARVDIAGEEVTLRVNSPYRYHWGDRGY